MAASKKPSNPSPAKPVHDPEPVPPQAPAPGDCCQSGCIPCVYDLYDDAMDRYREQLRAWRARHGSPA
ncbi:oxidoreductase-like domain-containing protein [Bordetella sp. BOR01]|uniref:oxidoreductase-like domain-containing protein n=1 Tax=Bordetella sp. BOR01 TaxID=2854779 RepID=UPI001C45AEDC|nr:oxidoreductase-like domain-containing protein [Bordetella sp. BOR01]MBV7486795.1 oxidoreductase-like domain-containing protein [Bordetella sp. BOR01]